MVLPCASVENFILMFCGWKCLFLMSTSFQNLYGRVQIRKPNVIVIMDNLRNRKNSKIRVKDKSSECFENNISNETQKKYIENYCKGSKENDIDINKDDEKDISTSSTKQKIVGRINFQVDIISISLLVCGLLTRMYKLENPRNIVFDELHYGKYVSLYMKNTFFFDSHPPLGKQLIAAMAYFADYDGKFKFDKIGSPYSDSVPLLALRFVPAFFGSLTIPTTYHLMLEMGLTQSASLLSSLLFLLDNALLTQSRFILVDSILLFFSLFGLLSVLKLKKHLTKPFSVFWLIWIILTSSFLTCALCIKYAGFYTFCLGFALILNEFWKILKSPKFSDTFLCINFIVQLTFGLAVASAVYLGVFYIHLNMLFKAGPHDSIMTSAFQASLEGGLASITKGQPLVVAHGSQITLRHTHGRTCWLHSHNAVYPIRYPDKRGSSHQQQVTCYSFKDVNNWWIVKRPDKNDLIVEQPLDVIKHGDIIQLVHGITSRALNSHDVAAPMSPQCQEVSCYIDYNISMPAQNLWRLEILNREHGDAWHTIQSLVRLVHVETKTALKFTGRQLPSWGFHQHEVAADRITDQDDTVWNVEEHRYTKSDDQKERERELVTAEMIPTSPTQLSFWQKFFELHYKMFFANTDNIQNHMYSSEPLEWPLMSRGIAYWVSSNSNAQIHLLGNIVIWYSATAGLLVYIILLSFYVLRRRRQCYDLDPKDWHQFKTIGEVFLTGYLFHYIPYFFTERTLFLHHYLPAFAFKTLLLVGVLEHIYVILKRVFKAKFLLKLFFICIFCWIFLIIVVFKKFLVLSYGMTVLTASDIANLRWKDTWDFIVHKN